jgi:hypothetical protein
MFEQQMDEIVMELRTAEDFIAHMVHDENALFIAYVAITALESIIQKLNDHKLRLERVVKELNQ